MKDARKTKRTSPKLHSLGELSRNAVRGWLRTAAGLARRRN